MPARVTNPPLRTIGRQVPEQPGPSDTGTRARGPEGPQGNRSARRTPRRAPGRDPTARAAPKRTWKPPDGGRTPRDPRHLDGRARAGAQSRTRQRPREPLPPPARAAVASSRQSTRVQPAPGRQVIAAPGAPPPAETSRPDPGRTEPRPAGWLPRSRRRRTAARHARRRRRTPLRSAHPISPPRTGPAT